MEVRVRAMAMHLPWGRGCRPCGRGVGTEDLGGVGKGPGSLTVQFGQGVVSVSSSEEGGNKAS